MPNHKSFIDFSGDFGGEDAEAAVLDHFRALKAAAKGIVFEDFPFPELAFILRVDGEVHKFGQSGLDNLDVDRKGEYLSVDIMITEDDRKDLQTVISSALLASPAFIKSASGSRRVPDFDAGILDAPLEQLCARYAEVLRDKAS